MSDLLNEICKDFQKRLECYEKDHPKASWHINVCDDLHHISLTNGRRNDLVALICAGVYGLAEDMDGDTVDNCIDLVDEIRSTTVASAKIKRAGEKGGGKAMLKALLKELADELDD